MKVYPGIELSHPGGTGLDDLEFHVLFIPVTIGYSYDVEYFQVA